MIILPESKINEIAELLDCGFRCFINRHSFEMISIPDTLKHSSIDTDAWQTENNELDNNYDDYLEIDPLESSESFKIMENFIETIEDSNKLKKQLYQSINKKHPFRNFKEIIDNSGMFRQKWFDFKSTKIKEWVITKINIENSS